ncbi:hypothetical protein [Pedobacter jamesrossensis]|uniref:Uncharacterized protein n=1 Tax=Pedobacter jamesrossensis TaxID=1908238 RepID=A0ABV8NNW4_9SPHI
MNYQFIYFEEHFQSLKAKTSFSKNFTQESTKNLEREFQRLTKMFKDISIDLNSQEKIKSYMNFHQQNLTLLMDQVSREIFEASDAKEKNLTIVPLKNLLGNLENILEWMQTSFPKIFNREDNVPISILLLEKKKIQNQLELIVGEVLNNYHSVELVNLITSVLNPEKICCFRELDYWQSAGQTVYEILVKNDKSDEFGLLKALLEIGINHKELYIHTCSYISQQVETHETLSERINTVCMYRKQIRQIFTMAKNMQFPGSPSAIKGVKKFLKEELLSLRAMEFINHEIEEAGIMNANYKVSFSVKQLAFFVHLQMETGIIIWQRAKFAHQYIARHFSTVERDSISEKSARNAHYNHASEDIKRVILKLGEMLALAQDRY